MPTIKLSAAKTVRLLSGHILPRNTSDLTCSHFDLKNPGEEPLALAYRCGKGKGRGEEANERGREGEKGMGSGRERGGKGRRKGEEGTKRFLALKEGDVK